ncbi:MAG TPA: FAD-dependent oxidoreductase [Candidatus Dormibacteraeota bacterium]|nr:FAD-dependent oxidoreductase [Candidatus Dormibacteraeota bacterium]
MSSRSPIEPPIDKPDLRPLLGESQLKALRRYGTEHHVLNDEILIADGDPSYDMIVLLDGHINIVDRYGHQDEFVVNTYGPREFIGEMSLLTGQSPYVTAVAISDGRILRISPPQVRVIMSEEPDLSDLILRAFLLRHSRLTSLGSGPVLVGSRFDADTHRLLEVLARNRLSSRWLDLEGSPETEAVLREVEVPVDELPIVILPGGSLLRNPSNLALLTALGLAEPPVEDESDMCDLLVIGAGPAGLSAAVYGASEGLSTMLAENTALGGQAGTSTRIENYLGFPAGLSGEELTARAVLQAQKFGVRIKLGTSAVELSSGAGPHQVRFDNGDTVAARSVIIATGARYNRLQLDRLTDFEGAGVYYAATQMEAKACVGGPVVVVGGGNSAGQAALYLARSCTDVRIAIRGESLAHSMSRYLIDQIERHPKIRVSTRTDVTGLVGDKALEGVNLRDQQSLETSTIPTRGLFVFIGANPSTEWLSGQLAADDHGFLLTGADIPSSRLDASDQPPLALETSRPGIFCVGDVRSRSIKRVAAAVGEGSMAVRLIFERLEATGLAMANSSPARPSTQRNSRADAS